MPKRNPTPEPQEPSPTIEPIVNDPDCYNFTRIPAGMLDPVYDERAIEQHAGRDAATLRKCHVQCPKKPCRSAKACLGGGALGGPNACASPGWDESAMLLSIYLYNHAIGIRERHKAWAIARDFGADLQEGDPHEGLADLTGT
ncbi:hypothetical protein [Oricola cellulosilytica]|uniref:Uncharacterized protein n=1 Tax=Oricola cellulosilytica TaxID=1429082 RepID=A0A4R0PGZ9_9HYPH|nr:hypothetical protein [Oricola cellulosilytica]TCD16153.1 hypothetical protein E0D97_01565 [Oricola cellulosilytica]